MNLQVDEISQFSIYEDIKQKILFSCIIENGYYLKKNRVSSILEDLGNPVIKYWKFYQFGIECLRLGAFPTNFRESNGKGAKGDRWNRFKVNRRTKE